jgi:uncharacterized protein (UPF0332 family)
MRAVEWFLGKGLLVKSPGMENIAENYLHKSRNNIITMELLSKAKNFKDALELPEDYEPDEWIVITAYYSMYLAALAVLAKVRFKSKNHTATVVALEEIFVRKKLLEKKYLDILRKVKLRIEEIERLEEVRNRREIAQYSPTKETTREIAEKSKFDAHRFVNRMEELFDSLD